MASNPLPIQRGASHNVATIVLEQPGRSVVVLDRALIARLDDALNEIVREAQTHFANTHAAREGSMFSL